MYKPAISKDAENMYYALVVRVDEEDQDEYVCRSYTGRYFKTEKAAIKSTTAHIEKLEAL